MKFHWILRITLLYMAKIALGSLALMLIWNALFPELFSWPVLNYPQAFLLLTLCRILLPFPGMSMMHMHYRAHCRSKMEGMSPEEKDAFRSKWEDRCRHWKSMHDNTDCNC